MITITIINDSDRYTPVSHYTGFEGQDDVLSVLEDALYVLWELTPAYMPGWKRELASTGVTAFDYHGTDPAIVEWIAEGVYRVNEN